GDLDVIDHVTHAPERFRGADRAVLLGNARCGAGKRNDAVVVADDDARRVDGRDTREFVGDGHGEVFVAGSRAVFRTSGDSEQGDGETGDHGVVEAGTRFHGTSVAVSNPGAVWHGPTQRIIR